MRNLVKILGIMMLTASCGHLHYVPIETGTTVNIKDSTVIHIKDSIRISEATVYKDLAWLGDTLHITGNRSSMWAYADTLKETLVGSLKEDEVEEKYKIIYKDRLVYRDSIQYKEVPVPVEIEKEIKVIPRFYRIFSIIGLVLSCFLLYYLLTYLKNIFYKR